MKCVCGFTEEIYNDKETYEQLHWIKLHEQLHYDGERGYYSSTETTNLFMCPLCRTIRGSD